MFRMLHTDIAMLADGRSKDLRMMLEQRDTAAQAVCGHEKYSQLMSVCYDEIFCVDCNLIYLTNLVSGKE